MMADSRTRPFLPRAAFAPAQPSHGGDVLVAVFLRGAADTLNLVVPHGEEAYYRLRPSLAIPRPDDTRVAAHERTIDLDGFFGFHPALRPLLPAWHDGHLAIVQACGAPDASRSHFKAMELMERGVSDESGPASGWIGRHLASLDTGNASPLRAIGVGELPQRSLYGSVPASALRSIADFHLGEDGRATREMRAALDLLYAGDPALGSRGCETLAVIEILEKLAPDTGSEAAAPYGEGKFSFGLQQVAMLIKAQVGLEVAAIDLGGWDTHFAQGAVQGLMAGLAADLAAGLAAFYEDLHAHLGRLSVVVMTEFGRRAYENASLGTDHGHGGMMLAIGGNVHGGRVHGTWPGLEQSQLFGPGDLAVTTDYRDVLAELCAQRLGNPKVQAVFPGHAAGAAGVFR